VDRKVRPYLFVPHLQGQCNSRGLSPFYHILGKCNAGCSKRRNDHHSPTGNGSFWISVEVDDLYAIKFDPSMKLEDFAQFSGGPMPKDVLERQEKINQSDALAFIYPVTWWGFPAILKGWIERVFSYEFAYTLTETVQLQGLLKHKKALLINTTLVSEADYKSSGIADAMKKIIIGATLNSCGIQNVEQVFLYDPAGVDAGTRKEYLDSVHRLGKEF